MSKHSKTFKTGVVLVVLGAICLVTLFENSDSIGSISGGIFGIPLMFFGIVLLIITAIRSFVKRGSA